MGLSNNEQRTTNNDNYEVIVVGGGHAGCEAAKASATLGASTLLLSTSLDTIGWIACSPSFGGPGRGQLLREIDALGGLMPKTVDESAIHYRHSGKDTACWAPFAICDRYVYHRRLKQKIEDIKNLYIKQDTLEEIVSARRHFKLITATGQIYKAKAVVVAAGTFLKGRIHKGQTTEKAGRNNEIAVDSLAGTLKALGFKTGVFRTGTGPTVRLNLGSLNSLELQPFESEPRHFSFATITNKQKQVATYKTHTTEELTKELRKQFNRSKIKGPRYCPSLLDKAIKFTKKHAHPVFIQPENELQKEWFINGLSMDFSEIFQNRFVRMVKGLESAQIVRYGYSVSYYYLKSGQLKSNLESKKHKGLFFAGQVTGSSGYEEAASAGLVAGANAALMAQGKSSFVLERNESYIGVLVDDLTNKNIKEPYRMLTSRVDDRLLLRCDNADIRLAPIGYKKGLVNRSVLTKTLAKEKIIKKAVGGGKPVKGLAPDIKREISIIKKYQPYLSGKI